MLSPLELNTLLAIADRSEGYRLPVPIGVPGVSRFAVEALAQYGMVVAEWETEMDPNIGNSMGWSVRLTDLGIDYIRGNIPSANGPMPMTQVSVPRGTIFGHGDYAVVEGIAVGSSLLTEGAGRKLKKDMKLKTGEVIRQGTSVDLEWLNPREPNGTRVVRIRIPGRKEPVTTSITNLHNYVTGVSKPPTLKSLEKMMDDAAATTPTGKRTEPDGTGPDGSPSWLMVLGYI